MSTYGNRPHYQTDTVSDYDTLRDFYAQYDEFDEDDFNDWYYDTYLPWATSHSGVADDQAEGHEETGVCSDESMYFKPAQAMTVDYSNEINPSAKFWARGRKQWRRFLRDISNPVNFAAWLSMVYTGVRANMDLRGLRRMLRNNHLVNTGRAAEPMTPVKQRLVKSFIKSLWDSFFRTAGVKRKLRF